MIRDRGRFLTLLTLTLSAILACTAQNSDSKKAQKPQTQDSSKIEPPQPGPNFTPPDPEGVEVPTNIAGSYLTCALRKEATDSDLKQQYGCFLADAVSGRKVDQDPLLSWSSSSQSGIEFVAPDSPYTAALYNTLVIVSGANKGEIDQKALTTDVIAMYGLKAVTVKRLYNVLKPAYDIKDFEAPILREQSIEENRDGSPVDPF